MCMCVLCVCFVSSGLLRDCATTSRRGLSSSGETLKDLRLCNDFYQSDVFDAFVIVDDYVEIWRPEQQPLVFPIPPFDSATSTRGRTLEDLRFKLATFKNTFLSALSKKVTYAHQRNATSTHSLTRSRTAHSTSCVESGPCQALLTSAAHLLGARPAVCPSVSPSVC